MSLSDGLTHELVGSTMVIRLTGDVDFVNSRELAMRVEQLCRDAHAVVLDLAATTYLDSAGVWLIDGAARTCGSQGIPLSLRARTKTLERPTSRINPPSPGG